MKKKAVLVVVCCVAAVAVTVAAAFGIIHFKSGDASDPALQGDGNDIQTDVYSIDDSVIKASMEDVTLSEDEMKEVLLNIGTTLETELKKADPDASVTFHVKEDGSCEFLVGGTDDDGSYVEPEVVSQGDSIRDFFAAFLASGYIDTDGNILMTFEASDTSEAASDSTSEDTASEASEEVVDPAADNAVSEAETVEPSADSESESKAVSEDEVPTVG